MSRRFRCPLRRYQAAGSARRCHEASEPAEVLGLYAQRNPRSRQLSCPLQEDIAEFAVDLEARGGVQKLPASPLGVLVGHLLMELHGGRVRVDVDESHLGAVLVDVSVDGKQTGLVRLDELEELSEELLKGFELAFLYRERSDYDERCGHDDSLLFNRIRFGLASVRVAWRGLPWVRV